MPSTGTTSAHNSGVMTGSGLANAGSARAVNLTVWSDTTASGSLRIAAGQGTTDSNEVSITSGLDTSSSGALRTPLDKAQPMAVRPAMPPEKSRWGCCRGQLPRANGSTDGGAMTIADGPVRSVNDGAVASPTGQVPAGTPYPSRSDQETQTQTARESTVPSSGKSNPVNSDAVMIGRQLAATSECGRAMRKARKSCVVVQHSWGFVAVTWQARGVAFSWSKYFAAPASSMR